MKIIQILLLWIISLYAGTFTEQTTKLTNTNPKQATINIGNLQVGQSGIVINQDNKDNLVILCYASVTASNEKESNITFQFQDILVQNAIPKTNLLPKDGDDFVLNHLYSNSMIIAPNFQALEGVKKLYSDVNFLNSDFFAAYLKMNNNPTPTKKDIVEFAHQNDLGRVFFVTKESIHIVDALSFKIIETVPFTIEDNTTTSPFYANIDEIKTSTFDFFGEESIGDYNKYYKKLLGITDGK